MAKPDDEGPLLVWNFPLIRTVQNRDGIFGMGLGSLIDGQSSDRGNSTRNDELESQTDSTTVDDEDSVLDDIEESIDVLDDNSEMLYGSSSDDVTITITEDGFEPEETEIGIGDTVTWVNQGNTTARISSVDDDFTSPILDPGDTYEEEFYSPGENKFKDPTSGNSERGVINVGTDLNPSDDNPVTFNSEDGEENDESSGDTSDSVDETTDNSTRSMDEAVTDKDNDDRGFE